MRRALSAEPMRSLLRAPSRGSSTPSDRIFFHNIWFRGHNNPRYTQLLPRLRRLDPYVVTCSDRRLLRGAEFRALRTTRKLRYRAVFTAAARRYRNVFCTDVEQTPFIHGRTVVDVDDPRFSAEEIALLSQPSVAAYVVTTADAGRRFESLGLATPWHVIPQGVDLSGIDRAEVAAIGTRERGPDELVIGYLAAWLLATGDRDGNNPLYNIDHLLELWDEIHARLPNARLWLIGRASTSLQRRCETRADIVLFGRLPQSDALAHVANFDIALYPRRTSHAPFAVKIAEYLGLGIPTVAYDLDLAQMIGAAGAGILARDPRAFVEGVVRLADEPSARAAMSASGTAAGADYDWDHLAARYEREILDRLLPPCATSVPPSAE